MTLKVIGSGLGRTGTLSLKLALEHLGFGPCYHMTEMMANVRRNLPLWIDAVRGRPDWASILDGYSSAVDHPTAFYWKELLAQWPEAKIIHTTRDPDGWFDSVHSTIYSPAHRAGAGPDAGPIGEFVDGTIYSHYGAGIDDRAYMTARFRAWDADVQASAPAGRLLVFRAQDGWEPLCAFLGVPVPAIPYPRVNSKEEMNAANRPSEAPSPEGMEAFARGYIAAARSKAFG